MNIFVVHPNPVKSARQLHDKHVVKMVLESTQMLANACVNGITPLYTKRFETSRLHWLLLLDRNFPLLLVAQLVNGRFFGWDFLGRKQYSTKGYFNHPCTVWVRENKCHLHWLVLHALALAQEYRRRYGRQHSCYKELRFLYRLLDQHNLLGDWRDCKYFTRAMPDELKRDDSISDVKAYRKYLSQYKPFYKQVWRRGKKPSWCP